MAIGRLKRVYRRLADIHRNTNFLADRLRKAELDEDARDGDALDFLELPTYTVGDGVDSGGALQNVTVNQLGLTGGNIDVVDHPAIIVEVGEKDLAQIFANVGIANQLGDTLMSQLRNEFDTRLNSTARTTAYDTSATYHDNVANAALTKEILFGSGGKVERGGAMPGAVEVWISPEAEGAFAALETFAREAGNTSEQMGAPVIGRVGSLAIVKSRQVPYRRSIAVTSSAIASNALTLTVASGHQVVPGMRISTSGLSANISSASPAAVSSVTGTTIVAPLTSGDNATNGAGTCRVESSECVVIDRGNCHCAIQMMPRLELEPGPQARISKTLKCFALFGRRMRTGNVRILHLAP